MEKSSQDKCYVLVHKVGRGEGRDDYEKEEQENIGNVGNKIVIER